MMSDAVDENHCNDDANECKYSIDDGSDENEDGKDVGMRMRISHRVNDENDEDEGLMVTIDKR